MLSQAPERDALAKQLRPSPRRAPSPSATIPPLRVFFSSRRPHTSCLSDWSSDVCSSDLQLKETINTMVDQLNAFAAEVTRVAREVGTDGKLGGQADVKDVSGVWKDLTDNVNSMAIGRAHV